MATADRNVRRRLEQFVANTACEANVLSAVHGIAMADVVRAEGGAPLGGEQSGFAIARGVQFERKLYDADAVVLREALADAGVLPSAAVPVVDLRLRAHGGPLPTLDAAAGAFRRFLTEIARGAVPSLPAVVIGPAVQLEAGALMPDGMFALDVLTVHAASEPCAAIVLRVGEIKAYPDRGGYTDPSQLAAARAQAGLYVHVLRRTLAALALEARVGVADDGFLVLTSPRAGRPSVRAGEDLRWQARRAADAFAKLLAAAERVLPPPNADGTVPPARVDAVARAPVAYDERCVAFCPRVRRCRGHAEAAGDPAVLGRDMVRLLGAIRLPRALELLAGVDTPHDEAETDLLRRLRARDDRASNS